MKHYSISRVLLFSILTEFNTIQLTHAGQLFADGFISDEDAKKILTRWPESIRLL
jgi:hypothetical protein